MSAFKTINTIILFVFFVATFNAIAKIPYKVNHTKKVSLRNLSSDCLPALAETTLEVNNVKANLGTGGELFYEVSITSPGYEVPKESGIYAIYAATNWIGAEDDEGNLKLAAPTYRLGPQGTTLDDFWPGPLNDGGSTDKNTCMEYDKIWSITKAEITAFKMDIEDGILDTELSEDFLNWKGAFIDEDGDETYVPANGDYPDIRGDLAKWYVINDKGNEHTASQAEALGVQIETMVYAYNTTELNHTTFVDYTIINKSGNTLNNTYFGTWLDPDLGYNSDDYIGCDSLRNLAICYNGDDFDELGGNPMSPLGYGENPPFLGVQIIDGIQSDGGLKLGMTSFIYYKNEDFIGEENAQTTPKTANDYYHFLQGIWKDGTTISFGRDGYNAGNPNTTAYAYPDEPSNSSGWSECVEEHESGDRKFVMASGPFMMEAGASKNLTQAVLWTRPVGAYAEGCPSFDGIQKLADYVLDFYDTNILEGDGLPVITIDGPTEITIPLGAESWDLPNATALDGLDGSLPVNVNLSQVDVNTPGEYSVIYSTFDSNGNTAVAVVTVIVSDEVATDTFMQPFISVYPNPAKNHINFNLEGIDADAVELYRLNGQLIQIHALNNNQINQLDVSNFKSGVYIYRLLKQNTVTHNGRFVKQ